jgi:hypothetical protein
MEKRKTLSRPLSRSEGFRHIENYYRSGLRPSEYYKQHGLSECQFYGWRRRYLSIHPTAGTEVVMEEKKFHRVRIESATGLRLSGLEIHYPHGVRVVIGADHPIEIEKLSELIKLRV